PPTRSTSPTDSSAPESRTPRWAAIRGVPHSSPPTWAPRPECAPSHAQPESPPPSRPQSATACPAPTSATRRVRCGSRGSSIPPARCARRRSPVSRVPAASLIAEPLILQMGTGQRSRAQPRLPQHIRLRHLIPRRAGLHLARPQCAHLLHRRGVLAGDHPGCPQPPVLGVLGFAVAVRLPYGDPVGVLPRPADLDGFGVEAIPPGVDELRDRIGVLQHGEGEGG